MSTLTVGKVTFTISDHAARAAVREWRLVNGAEPSHVYTALRQCVIDWSGCPTRFSQAVFEHVLSESDAAELLTAICNHLQQKELDALPVRPESDV